MAYVSNGFITVLRGWKDDPQFDDKIPDNRPRTNSVPVHMHQSGRDDSSGSTDTVESTVRYITVLVPMTLNIKKDDRFRDDKHGDTYRVTDVDAMAPMWAGHKTVVARWDGSGSY